MNGRSERAPRRAARALPVLPVLVFGLTASRSGAQSYMNDGSSVYSDSWADDSLIYGYGATSGVASYHWYRVNVRITSPLGRTAAGTSGQYVPGFVQGNAMITWSYDDWGDYLVNTEHGGFCTWSYVYFLLAEIQRRQQPPPGSEPCTSESRLTCAERNGVPPYGPFRSIYCRRSTHCCTQLTDVPYDGWCRQETCQKCPGQTNDPVNSRCYETRAACLDQSRLFFCLRGQCP